ncbi:copper homeostasis periplasmic binding protein CopC [Paraburkholderia sp.]|uniref:copper homeostasis periplasmic binding protein CopC n=1 Tax=Paraburkholderia sp. TaxID=1926495 RepID=UPI003D6E449D
MTTSTSFRPLVRVLATGAAALAVASTAFAHALPVSRDPAPDTEVAAPAQVTIRFSEPLEPAFSKIVVDDAAGKPVGAGPSAVDANDRKTMHAPLASPLVAGRYTVHWNAVATDGHRTHGDYGFAVK